MRGYTHDVPPHEGGHCECGAFHHPHELTLMARLDEATDALRKVADALPRCPCGRIASHVRQVGPSTSQPYACPDCIANDPGWYEPLYAGSYSAVCEAARTARRTARTEADVELTREETFLIGATRLHRGRLAVTRATFAQVPAAALAAAVARGLFTHDPARDCYHVTRAALVAYDALTAAQRQSVRERSE